MTQLHGNSTSTTIVNDITIGAMGRHGWDDGQPCYYTIRSPRGTTKTLALSEAHGLTLNVTLAYDLACQKHASDPKAYPVLTVNLEPLVFSGNVTISDNFTIFMHLEDFELNLDRITDSHIGDFIEKETEFIEKIQQELLPAEKEVINDLFA